VKPDKAAQGARLRLHPALGCVPLELHYDFLTATGALVMADSNSCDMQGCIAVFAAIDPHVCAIQTFSGCEAHALYTRHGQRWEASGRHKSRP